jgi:hypothetical protein
MRGRRRGLSGSGARSRVGGGRGAGGLDLELLGLGEDAGVLGILGDKVDLVAGSEIDQYMEDVLRRK